MEATAVSIGKSVLNGALGYAKSAVAEEVALQFGVQRDKAFITDELEMMQSFLMVAHEKRDDHNKVVRTWVKQVRDVAYNVEDSLQDFALCIHERSWWRIPRTLLKRRYVANQMKELRAKVEDVSQRNLRYRLIDGASKPAKDFDDSNNDAGAMFGIDKARRKSANQHQSRSRLDLAQLISKEGESLGVIGVWGTSGTVGHTSIIWEAYENPNVKMNFPCRAWVRLAHPFHPKEFIQSIVKQFQAAVGVGVLLEEERTGQELAQDFNRYVNENRYLVVLTDLSTIEEWHHINTCFPDNKLGSRIVVSTKQVEVASLCTGQQSMVSELKQLSADQTIYAFFQQSSLDAPFPSYSACFTAGNEIQEDQSNTDVNGKIVVQDRIRRTNTMAGVLEEFQLVGREKEKADIIELIIEQASTEQFEVIAVWGMGGLGKTTLIKDVYQRQEVSGMFGKHAFVTVLRPFKLEELLRSLALQLDVRKGAMDFAGDTQKKITSMGVADLTEVLGRLSQGKTCLIILDDLSSTMEWDKMLPILLAMKSLSLVIVITTRREDVAKHCCKKPKCIRLLNGLEDKDAFNLFTKKVFKNRTTDLAKQYPELAEPAKLILRKCNGLPLAIVTIGGFLADQPTKTVAEWRKLNEHISVELEMNPKFEAIKTVLMKSYDGLPYYLKSFFLYLSIFPEDRNVRRRRLVHRWIAEGYARDRFVADRYFMELVERSMILPTQNSVCSMQGFDSCQLHDLIRDISIAKSKEQNLVFRLEEGCTPHTHGAVRHLAISSNWKGDKCEFESTVEVSCIRSLTVFGEWKPFYISDKMRFLRVLDLEGTKGLKDHHLKNIGKLLHLRYLSLRWCNIHHLPKSVANLSQLETLDIKYAMMCTLPKTISKLTKLRYLHAGGVSGVTLPRGMRKLKSLHTLRSVYLGKGNVGIRAIKGLTSLRKLGVCNMVDMAQEKGLELCSAISSNLSCLEYLSLSSYAVDWYDCFHDISPPPENLQCLKLQGRMSKFPGWIKGLQNLVKLKLAGRVLSLDDATMQALGNLPNLSILVWLWSSPDGECITFPAGLFRSLVVLELGSWSGSVNFEPTSMPKLEVLRLEIDSYSGGFSGLEFLPSVKEVLLGVLERDFEEETTETYEVKEDITKQLTSKQSRPILKLELIAV